MKLFVLAVGNKMPDWVDAAFAEYAKRMPKEMPLQLKALKPAQRDGNNGDASRWLDAEADRIEAAMPKSAVRVVLDERGSSFATRTLAQQLSRWREDGRDIAFVIGGADGLAQSVKTRADIVWSLSPLTLPHGMVRMVLAEQLYRAWTLLSGHPYHRD